MRMTVIGCGYLGAVHAPCMADLGHDVIGVDVDEVKVKELAAGRAPFFEPGLPELLERAAASGRLRFTTDVADVARAPGDDAHRALHLRRHPAAQGRVRGRHLATSTGRSRASSPTCAPATWWSASRRFPWAPPRASPTPSRARRPGVLLAWNPEFLREGYAVHDTQHPDRLVFGLPDDPDAAAAALALLEEAYAGPVAEGAPVVVADYPTGELVKTAANAFLATKISFINAMAEVCEAAGADVVRLAEAIGHDERIGRKFLGAGLGFGGGCLPKDIRAFMARAGELGADQALTFLREVDNINMRRRIRMVELAREELGGSFLGTKVAVLGAAFKANSDDIRDSPALNVAAQIRLQGADVVVTDPAAIENARRLWPELQYATSVEEACAKADAVLVLTEWAEYKALDPVALGELVRRRHVLDGRNALDADRWKAAGWTYRALGRPRA